jgi:hypothetical protein
MGEFRDFVADIVQSEGAVIESVEPDGLDVVAPEPLRAVMGWPEFTRLGFGTTLPVGAMPVGLEGDWLDRFGVLLGDRGRLAERQLVVAADAKVAAPRDAERLLDRAFDLPNAVWRLLNAKPTWTSCLLLAFHYTAISDEKREGLVWIGFNQGTGAVIDGGILASLRKLLASEMDWHAPEPHVRRTADVVYDGTALARVRPLVDHHVRRDLESFLTAIRRRLDRDRGRIHEYHDDLRRTAQMKLAALSASTGDKADADRKRETGRIAAIEREYAAKLDDLRHNYALRVTIDWTQGLVLFAPVHRFDVLIKRRKSERLISVDWHSAIRMIEPPPCDWGLGLESARLVCDDRLHLTDPSGQAPCMSCGKPWCRACHPAACPCCGRPI